MTTANRLLKICEQYPFYRPKDDVIQNVAEWVYNRHRSTELRLKALPHPVRSFRDPVTQLELSFGMKVDDAKDFARQCPGFIEFLDSMSQRAVAVEKVTDMSAGSLSDSEFIESSKVFAAYWWWSLNGSHQLQTTDALEEQLQHSDMEDIESKFFRAPFKSCYIEFGQHRLNPQHICLTETDTYPLEGAYVFEYEAVIGPEYYDNLTIAETERVRNEIRGIKDGEKVRVLHVFFIGSPITHKDPFDDGFQDARILIPEADEDRPLVETFTRFWESDEAMSRKLGLREAGYHDTYKRDAFKQCLMYLSKVLLYMGCANARTASYKERTDLEKLLGRRGPKKQGKLGRRLEHAYDRVVVGPISAPTLNPQRDGQQKAPHVRRGHWHNVVVGKQRLGRELRFFEPIVVNADLQDAEVASKPYVIKGNDEPSM